MINNKIIGETTLTENNSAITDDGILITTITTIIATFVTAKFAEHLATFKDGTPALDRRRFMLECVTDAIVKFEEDFSDDLSEVTLVKVTTYLETVYADVDCLSWVRYKICQ